MAIEPRLDEIAPPPRLRRVDEERRTMAISKKNSKADAYFDKAKKWQPELRKLRAIALSLDLKEELKWGKPCYPFDDANIIILIP